MRNESDGQSPSENIDAIKELLRKLEEVAERDPSEAAASFDDAAEQGSRQQASPESAEKAAPEPDPLLALKRGTSLKAFGDASLPRPIVIDMMPNSGSEPDKVVRPELAFDLSSRRGVVIAAGSFVLGVAAAGALILAWQPVSQILRGPVPSTPASVAQQSSPRPIATTSPETPRPAEVAQVNDASSPAAMTSPPSAAPAEQTRSTPDAAPQSAPATPGEPDRTATISPSAVISPPAPVQIRSAPQPQPQAPPAAVEKAAEAAAYRIETPERVELRAGERRSVDVRLAPPVSETARLLVVLRNVPAWLSLSKGGAVGKEIWLLPAHQAADVVLEAAEGASGSVELKVQLATIDGRILAERAIAVRATGFPSANAPMVASAPSASDQMLQRLQARGELLLDTGEIEAARTLFRTAAESGSVMAALRLAETYDPGEIQRFGMMETAADAVLAVRWYEHAQALGSPVATARLATLGRR